MRLKECAHCNNTLEWTGNWGCLLLGRSYFCKNCGYPGLGLKTIVAQSIRSFFTRGVSQKKLVSEKQGG